MKRAWSHSSEHRPSTPPRRSGGIQQISETPRSVKGDVGSIGQNHIRSDVMQQMIDEMLCCDIDEFLCHYAPFCPTDNAVDSALKKLEDKKYLQGNQWQVFIGGTKPSDSKENEEKAFKWIEKIVEALTEHDSMAPRACNFKYSTCGSTYMAGEIAGPTFRIDGYFSPLSCTPLAGKVVVSQVAVAAEFKKKDDIYDNRRKLVSAANHIMNDDPRRMWMYGITIEGEHVSIWYFSRSHSVMSKSFDFTKDPRKFVTVLLSLLFATELEMGFDPTVHRIMFKGKIRYVYKLTPKESNEMREPLYFRTTATIFNPRITCISGRKTRVWRAIQVTGPDGLKETGDKEVVLKDVWLDKGSQTEKQNQDLIYGELRQIKEEDYEWMKFDYRERVRDALAKIPDSLPFMRILHDSEGVDCKERLESAEPDRTILSASEPRASSSRNVSPWTSQNGPSYSATGTSHGAQASRHLEHRPQRQYKAKTQYRLVYAQVGHALHDTRFIDKAFKAINDVLTALVLLFLAGWVHRDISTGNIIVVENNGCIRGLVSDLEYAKAMSNESASSDPKTGTPYFMPLEVHLGERFDDQDTSSSSNEEEEQNPLLPLPILPLKYSYHHDHESLMWVALYIVYGLVDWEAAQKIWPEIFANSFLPSKLREMFFKRKDSPLKKPFYAAFHDQFGPTFPTDFNLIRKKILHICRKSEPKEKEYHKLFNGLIFSFDRLLEISVDRWRDVPFVEQSGQANVEVGTSQSVITKRKMENADIIRVRTAPPVKRARSSTGKAAGKTAGKTTGKAKR